MARRSSRSSQRRLRGQWKNLAIWPQEYVQINAGHLPGVRAGLTERNDANPSIITHNAPGVNPLLPGEWGITRWLDNLPVYTKK